jgi:uncharacterized membrane protein YidH (DUF202 family)
MAKKLSDKDLVRPERMELPVVPAVPDVDQSNAEKASTAYSFYRSNLSHFRTGLSEHRTDLSEYRTNLSIHRTDLSTDRTEMSMRRTGMSFQRTRMSADRTLMSVLRTSLSLIGFGFTIYQAFEKLRDAGVIRHAGAPRNFGVTLIVLGVVLLLGGIVRHVQYLVELRRMRGAMRLEHLIHGETAFPVSVTLLVALALVLVGIGAAASIIFGFGLFS